MRDGRGRRERVVWKGRMVSEFERRSKLVRTRDKSVRLGEYLRRNVH